MNPSSPSDYIRVPESERWHLPHEPASVPGYVKHVSCEGSRSHVQSYSGYADWRGGIYSVTHCTEPKCIINYEAEQTIAAHRPPWETEKPKKSRKRKSGPTLAAKEGAGG